PSPVTRTPSLCQGPLHVTESALESVTRNEAFPGRSDFRLMPDSGGSKPQPEALRHLSASPPSNDRCEISASTSITCNGMRTYRIPSRRRFRYSRMRSASGEDEQARTGPRSEERRVG